MSVIQARTREELRAAVGRNSGIQFRLLEADATGTASTFLTDELSLGGENEHKGQWLVFISGTNDGSIRRVVSSTIANNRTSLKFHPTVSAVTADGDTAELWPEEHNPTGIHDFINQTIIDATGYVFDPIENTTLHSDGKTARFDIPSDISMIQHVQYRAKVTSTSVHQMERAFDETTDSDFTQTVDTEDFRRSSSLKLTIGGGVSAGNFITDSITSLDLSKYTHLEGWVKATTTLAAADFVIHLDNGSVQANGTDLESLNVPATTAADTWTFFQVALANPETDSAIVSVGLEYNANQAANTVWFDELAAVFIDSAIWMDVPRHLWHIDKEARDLILHSGAVSLAGYSLLKLVGGDKPALLSTDATASEISGSYIIYRATGLALLAQGGGPSTDQDERRQRAREWLALAEQEKRNFPSFENVRVVD
jgi:hypothetical protein